MTEILERFAIPDLITILLIINHKQRVKNSGRVPVENNKLKKLIR